MKDKEKIAVFIDADNAPAGKIDIVLSELARYGVVNIRKAYGNWKNPNIKPWEDVLHDYAIQPVQQFDLTKGKNATDMALVIDVMDVIYTKHIDIICLVSSDCDFTPLVTRTLADGKFVIGFGERKAPLPFVNSCSRFLYLDAEPALEQPIQKQSKNIKGDTKLINLLRQAIDAIGEDDGLSLDQILIPCAIKSLAARKPSSLLCRASQPSQRAPQLAIPVRLLSIKPPSLAIAM